MEETEGEMSDVTEARKQNIIVGVMRLHHSNVVSIYILHKLA